MRRSSEFICIVIATFNRLVIPLDCPSIIFVEPSQDAVIDCKILAGHDVYWYKGRLPGKNLIAKLESGEVDVIGQKQHYDLNEYGSLIVEDVKDELYGFYSVLDYDPDYTHDTDIVELRFAVKPPKNCPIFNSCMNCHGCNLTGRSSGYLSCSITRTRPKVYIEVFVEYNDGYSVVFKNPETIHDPVTDTWNTTSTIEYNAHSCGSSILVRCVAKEGHPFNLSESYVHIKSDYCKTTTQISGYQTPLAEDPKRIYAPAIAIISIGVIFVVIVLVLSIVLCRKSGIYRQRKTYKGHMETDEETELLRKRNTPADVQPFIDTLKNTYKDFRVFTSTPNGECIPPDDVFQEVNFTLTKADNDNTTISSSQMIETLLRKERSFVFIDDGEYGRKAFMQYVCSGLCSANLGQDIILYVNLKGLDRNMTIANAVQKQMNSDEKISTDDIRNILATQKCHFVFDEVHELNQSDGDESTLNLEKQHPGEVTINDVITGSHRFERHRKARSLFISKNTINVTSSFTERHTYIRIEPFSRVNLKLYVSRIFKCYQNLNATNTNKSSEKTVDTVDDENKVVSSVIAHTDDGEITTCVSNLILDKENIIRQMDMCPSSLILLIHLLISDITKKLTDINNITFYIIRRSYLTQLILDCLQFQYFPCQAKYRDVDHLMLKLGQASFENSLEDDLFTETCKFISECTRKEFEEKTSKEDFATAFSMGLLKLVTSMDCSKLVTDDVSYPSPDSLVEFRHNYIQEYAAAQAIASNKTVHERFLKSKGLKEDDRMKRVLLFMHRKEAKKRREFLKMLVEKQNWNNVIDCLFECENDDDFTKIKSALSHLGGKYAVNIIDTDKLYHGMAVSRFCKTLANHNVSLEALTFRRTCELQYFSKLKIPEVKFLVFLEIDFQQGNNFIDFVEMACQMNVKEKIQFVRCKCPKEIAKEKIVEIAEIIKWSPNAPKIHRTDDVVTNAYENFPNVQWYKLNLENGRWEKV